MTTLRSTLRSRRESGDRGAVLVELALVLPVLLLITFGLIDLGLAWRDKVTVETAARAGARTASNLGNSSLADYNLLQTVLSGMNGIPQSNIDEVVVFNANSSSTPSATCKGGTAVANLCNVYTSSSYSLSSSSFGCNGGPDTSWCPKNRNVSQATGTDYLGVYVKAHRSSLTKLIVGGTFSMTATAVFRLEPSSS